MEGVEGLMRSLKLSEAELQGVKLGRLEMKKGEVDEPQAIGKLLSGKQAHTEAIENALGPIWCPMRRF
jgi:hypothetical protein